MRFRTPALKTSVVECSAKEIEERDSLSATERQWRELRSYICLLYSSVYPSLMQELSTQSELSPLESQET